MITGYFGMNVHGAFINSANPYSGWYVLATLVVVTVVEIWLFSPQRLDLAPNYL